MSPKKEPASVKTIGSHRVGDVVELTAVRMNDQGVFLDAGTGNTSDDILLHKHQMTSPVSVGDKVKVQLYLDAKNRITASMKLPKMREGQLGYVNVISVNRMGGFVDIGAERGVFLPYSEMRGHVSPNQHIWVKLYRDKSGRQAVTMRVEEDMERASRPAEGVKVGDALTGTVYNILKDGFSFLQKNAISLLSIAVKSLVDALTLVSVSQDASPTFVQMDTSICPCALSKKKPCWTMRIRSSSFSKSAMAPCLIPMIRRRPSSKASLISLNPPLSAPWAAL